MIYLIIMTQLLPLFKQSPKHNDKNKCRHIVFRDPTGCQALINIILIKFLFLVINLRDKFCWQVSLNLNQHLKQYQHSQFIFKFFIICKWFQRIRANVQSHDLKYVSLVQTIRQIGVKGCERGTHCALVTLFVLSNFFVLF